MISFNKLGILTSIKNIVLDSYILNDTKSFSNLIDSIQVRLFKTSSFDYLSYFESINILTKCNNKHFNSDINCDYVLLLIRKNILLNLKHDIDVFKFLINCGNFKLKASI